MLYKDCYQLIKLLRILLTLEAKLFNIMFSVVLKF